MIRWLATTSKWLVLGVMLWLAAPAAAQSTTSIEIQYGERITFRVADADLIGGSLRVTAAEAVIADGQAEVTENGLRYVLDAANLPPAASLSAAWTVTTADGTVRDLPPETHFYITPAVDWQTTQGPRVTVWTAAGTADPVVYLTWAEESLAMLEADLRHDSETRYTLVVYGELSLFTQALRSHNTWIQDWVAAYALPEHRIALTAVGPGGDALLQRDIAHEMAHLMLHDISGGEPLPGWLDEGIALSTGENPALDERLAEALRSGETLPLDALCATSFTALPPHEASLAYAQSQSVAAYVRTLYGSDGLRAALDASARGEDCPVVLDSLGGDQWLAYARREQARTSGAATGWIVVLAISAFIAALFVWPQQPRDRRADYRAALADDDPTPYQ
ncbi:MAG: hypothetical protein GYB64_20200 [Chloroflexi bacterium]|nr:hypothetical protein [Chloroflexota bacterium]